MEDGNFTFHLAVSSFLSLVRSFVCSYVPSLIRFLPSHSPPVSSAARPGNKLIRRVYSETFFLVLFQKRYLGRFFFSGFFLFLL